jgi:hypothetical protein
LSQVEGPAVNFSLLQINMQEYNTTILYIKKRPGSTLCNLHQIAARSCGGLFLVLRKKKEIFYVQEAQADMDSGLRSLA